MHLRSRAIAAKGRCSPSNDAVNGSPPIAGGLILRRHIPDARQVMLKLDGHSRPRTAFAFETTAGPIASRQEACWAGGLITAQRRDLFVQPQCHLVVPSSKASANWHKRLHARALARWASTLPAWTRNRKKSAAAGPRGGCSRRFEAIWSAQHHLSHKAECTRRCFKPQALAGRISEPSGSSERAPAASLLAQRIRYLQTVTTGDIRPGEIASSPEPTSGSYSE